METSSKVVCRSNNIELGTVTDHLFEQEPPLPNGLNSNISSSSVSSSVSYSYSSAQQPEIINYSSYLSQEALESLRLMTDAKLNILFLCGPFAFIGSAMGIFGEALCFCLAGLALIPCAERLSFVTEQVAEHTNGTIGALLNATFGNAPEFLISSAALRSGLYRVVQLTLLGSMLTNLLFVFGLSCLIGGMQWQVQEIRITSGNVSIAMLLIATMGLVLPAALKLGHDESLTSETMHENEDQLTESDIHFSRINALVMVLGYICYLVFQLGSHKDEFDYDGNEYSPFGGGHNIVRTMHSSHPVAKKPPARKNLFCHKYCFLMKYCPIVETNARLEEEEEDVETYYDYSTEMVTLNDSANLPDPQCTIKRIGHNKISRNRQRSPDQKEMNGLMKISENSTHDYDVDEIAALHPNSTMKSHCSDAAEDEEQGKFRHPYASIIWIPLLVPLLVVLKWFLSLFVSPSWIYYMHYLLFVVIFWCLLLLF